MGNGKMISRMVLLIGIVAIQGACMTVYQPMSGLHRPVIVDPQIANFQDLRIKAHCVPGEFMPRRQAEVLCRRMEALLTNQGAKVSTITTLGGLIDPEDEEEEEGEKKISQADKDNRSKRAQKHKEFKHDLTVRIKARLIHEEENMALTTLFYVTGTLSPRIAEYTFAQDITIYDASGFLLGSDSLKGRFIEYTGIGIWGVNKILDWTVREDSEKLTGDQAKNDFSKDFYAQLSQMIFNANMQRRVLNSSADAKRPRQGL